MLGNRYALYAVGVLLIFQLLFTYAPPLPTLFVTTAIGMVDWLYISVVALSIVFLVELEKCYIRRRRRVEMIRSVAPHSRGNVHKTPSSMWQADHQGRDRRGMASWMVEEAGDKAHDGLRSVAVIRIALPASRAASQ